MARLADHLPFRHHGHLLMGIGQYAVEGVLRLSSDAGDGHARGLFLHGLLSLLHLWGSDAGPDVFPDRYLGKRPSPLFGHQVLSVYAVRRRYHAAGNSVRLLLSRRPDGNVY